MSREARSRELTDQQRDAIEHVDGPLLIVAGAGTGKTRVIVERVGYLLRNIPGLHPQNILALTFSDKAAEEMRRRAAARFREAHRCRFSTYHSFCLQLLLKHSPRTPPWKPIDELDHWIFLRRNLERLDLDYYLRVSEPGRFLNDLLEFCSRCHDNLVSPASYSAYAENLRPEILDMSPGSGKRNKKKPKPLFEEEVARRRETARVFAQSEAIQEEAGLVSFGAMLARVVTLLENSPELRGRLQRRYPFILVDEFQDTNWAQIELLRLLAGETRNVTVVGDRKQAIYHFRGASHTSFDLFKQTFPEYREVVLDQNYRSTKRILSVAEAVISLSNAEGGQPTQQLRTSNELGEKVEVWECVSDAEEAEAIACEIARQVRDGEAKAWSDFAVLYRAHLHRNYLVSALRRHNVPFAIRKLAINNQPAVRDLVACLRAIGHRNDSISLLRVMSNCHVDPSTLHELCRTARSQQRTLRDVTEQKFAEPNSSSGNKQPTRVLLDLLHRYETIAQEQRLAAWLHNLRDELRLFSRAEDAGAWRAFSEFVKTWDGEKCANGLLREFLEYFAYFEEARGTINLPDEDASVNFSLDEQSSERGSAKRANTVQRSLWDESPDDSQGKVQLMTMHAAKGLEFEHVFLLHLIRGAFPSRRQDPLIEFPIALLKGPAPLGDIHKEEERRLFYVALTRAKRRLTLCTVANDKRKPSEFLQQLRDSDCPDLEWKQIPPHGAPPQREVPMPAILKPLAKQPDVMLSVSGMEAYLECPLKYFFSHVWRVPIMPSAALRFGSIMHTAISTVVSAIADGAKSMQSMEIEAVLRQSWSDAGFTDSVQRRKYWEMGLRQLQGLSANFTQDPFELLAQEKAFQFSRGGVRVVGRIDQINRLNDKQVEVIEYKSGRAHTQKQADENRQLTLYALACRDVLNLEPVSLVLYNLETQEQLRTKRNAADFRELEQLLAETSSNIGNNHFPPAPAYQCRTCDYKTLCPAHDDFN
ncbi:MAG: ATP-dependent helicase [Acidobacteria bacterium]|nr:ATP-dependent helicase [Acidobacteriota bacterium]